MTVSFLGFAIRTNQNINNYKMDISNKKHFLTVKDYSVSQEIFDLYHDQELDMLITSPQPSLESLGK